MDNNKCFILFHIMKTAGTSLRKHLAKHLVLHESFIGTAVEHYQDEKEKGLTDFHLKSLEERNKAYVMMGHWITKDHARYVTEKDIYRVTFLRNPVARSLSHYNYEMRFTAPEYHDTKIGYGDFIHTYRAAALGSGETINGIVPFEEWHAYQIKDFMMQSVIVNYLKLGPAMLNPDRALEKVIKCLDDFWFVGTQENYEHDVNYILSEMGLPRLERKSNVAGVDFKKYQEVTPEIESIIYHDDPQDRQLFQRYFNRSST